ncbi:hypothetical protein [Bathymodiolus japonicus methanotrophic gill symbiont]|uniref:hypothetical protein n=1 Tax=Bathymodiolus japonicus methanotrophic gill symbiont TaxID=113269 RepID=UPI001C8D0181|nr:hypothetical protein [Bathymodiolus japonicus methanotrophic gill symbiont]
MVAMTELLCAQVCGGRRAAGASPIRCVGESLFLRKLVLGIPAQASSKNLTRPLMPPAAPIRPRHLVPTQQGVGT